MQNGFVYLLAGTEAADSCGIANNSVTSCRESCARAPLAVQGTTMLANMGLITNIRFWRCARTQAHLAPESVPSHCTGVPEVQLTHPSSVYQNVLHVLDV